MSELPSPERIAQLRQREAEAIARLSGRVASELRECLDCIESLVKERDELRKDRDAAFRLVVLFDDYINQLNHLKPLIEASRIIYDKSLPTLEDTQKIYAAMSAERKGE